MWRAITRSINCTAIQYATVGQVFFDTSIQNILWTTKSLSISRRLAEFRWSIRWWPFLRLLPSRSIFQGRQGCTWIKIIPNHIKRHRRRWKGRQARMPPQKLSSHHRQQVRCLFGIYQDKVARQLMTDWIAGNDSPWGSARSHEQSATRVYDLNETILCERSSGDSPSCRDLFAQTSSIPPGTIWYNCDRGVFPTDRYKSKQSTARKYEWITNHPRPHSK